MESILIHTCCAPCSILVIDKFKKDYEITLFFYNPNIHPYKEYLERLNSFKSFAENQKINYIVAKYEYKDYFMNITKNFEDRCKFCYQLRLNQAAIISKELNIKNFTTTMLYSPYQKHDIIKTIGELLAKNYDLNFIYFDLRERYADGVKLSKDYNLYRQKYCGCIFSEIERFGGGR
ncbi:MAG: epoxyqueuosine reductase QueH [Caldisericia bacterium]|jgi:predicted adenine nucleotide alpha hydrolase (AANH) superfamily ATPase|nr:epoxyqueuosine reductase QueH [Caldisericia bacterium]